MQPLITTLSIPAFDFLEQAEEFYKACERKVSLNSEDTLVVAFVDDEVGGIVRLCFEKGHFVLRTMQIKPNHQRKGLGSILLDKFDDLIREKKIMEIFCMPYDYLEPFYSQIGFRKIQEIEAPEFLQQRARDFRQNHSDKDVILMRRVA